MKKKLYADVSHNFFLCVEMKTSSHFTCSLFSNNTIDEMRGRHADNVGAENI